MCYIFIYIFRAGSNSAKLWGWFKSEVTVSVLDKGGEFDSNGSTDYDDEELSQSSKPVE